MEDIEVVRLITFIDILKKNPASKNVTFFFPYSLPFPALICWCGISQVVSNSVASAFKNAFHIPPLYTTSCSRSTCRDYCSSKKCNGKGFGYYRSDYGRMLFIDYIVYHYHKYHTASLEYFHVSFLKLLDSVR